MAVEDQAKLEDSSAEEKSVQGESMTKDEQRIAEWSAAYEKAPGEEDLFKLREKIEKAESVLAKANSAYEEAAARRALVVGWTEVADQEGISAKRLHSWHRQYVPEEPDLTDVPRSIIPREKRRIESMNEKIERRKQVEQEAEERAERFRSLLKGWDEK